MQRDLFRALVSGGNQLLDHEEGLMPGVLPNKSHDEGASADRSRNFAASRLGPPTASLSCHVFLGVPDRGNEARTRIAKLEPTRLEHVTREKKAGERKPGDDVVAGCLILTWLQEKLRQGQ